MSKAIHIDFVSDVVCPWCAVGLGALQQAIANLGDEVAVTLAFKPFELNPDMPPEGQDIVEHIQQKYGSTPEQVAANREHIRQRGAEVGFRFDMQARGRIYNTFDAHRLLHWAGEQSARAQRDLKLSLFTAYFTEGRDPSDHALLLERAVAVGLDAEQARAVLASERYADAVRDAESLYHSLGVSSVPAVIINERHLISGGQPPEVFEQALRQIAAESGR